MIAAFVAALRPLFEPLLKLRMAPPHLPEGASAIRHLKPVPAYLTYRYLGALLGVSGKVLALIFAAAAAVFALGPWGVAVAGAIALYLVGFVSVMLVAIRLDWELRDFLIGSRSIRLREGAWVQREVTLSYANVQNVEVTQGPLERAFGFQNLRVSTAGGAASQHGLASAHDALLVGLVHAEEIRTLILDAVRQYRDAGLGDHRDGPRREEMLGEIRDAARALRQAAEGHPVAAR